MEGSGINKWMFDLGFISVCHGYFSNGNEVDLDLYRYQLLQNEEQIPTNSIVSKVSNANSN